MGQSASDILGGNRLGEYFRDEVRKASIGLDLELPEIVEFYLVNLLSNFEKAEHLFVMQDGHHEEEPLALMLAHALDADSTTRLKELKKMGDTALYLSGFFSEHIQKGHVDIDYYISMGSGAYGSVAGMLTGQKTFCELYASLSEKFLDLTSLLNEISLSEHLKNNLDLLRLYERWLKTGDEKLKAMLVKEGLICRDTKIFC